jgi:hypothetical protein
VVRGSKNWGPSRIQWHICFTCSNVMSSEPLVDIIYHTPPERSHTRISCAHHFNHPSKHQSLETGQLFLFLAHTRRMRNEECTACRQRGPTSLPSLRPQFFTMACRSPTGVSARKVKLTSRPSGFEGLFATSHSTTRTDRPNSSPVRVLRRHMTGCVLFSEPRPG